MLHLTCPPGTNFCCPSWKENSQDSNCLISNLERENEADEVVVEKVVGTNVESTLEVDPGHLGGVGEGINM